jgi:surface antigen
MTMGYKRLLALVLLLSVVLAGCDPTTGMPGTKATVGGLGGAAAGGLLAAAAGGGGAGIAAGVILGGLVGGAIGDRMDAADRREAQQAAVRALETAPSGTSVAWKNPDSGHSGAVTPTRTYQNASGQYCREYQQSITINGQQNRAYGTACRQPDGSWQIVN